MLENMRRKQTEKAVAESNDRQVSHEENSNNGILYQ